MDLCETRGAEAARIEVRGRAPWPGDDRDKRREARDNKQFCVVARREVLSAPREREGGQARSRALRRAGGGGREGERVRPGRRRQQECATRLVAHVRQLAHKVYPSSFVYSVWPQIWASSTRATRGPQSTPHTPAHVGRSMIIMPSYVPYTPPTRRLSASARPSGGASLPGPGLDVEAGAWRGRPWSLVGLKREGSVAGLGRKRSQHSLPAGGSGGPQLRRTTA